MVDLRPLPGDDKPGPPSVAAAIIIGATVSACLAIGFALGAWWGR